MTTNFRKLLGTILFSLILLNASAQIFITYNNGATPHINEDIIACGLNSISQVKLIVTDDNADNAQFALTLPSGVTYEPGSISTIQSTNGLSITPFDISDPNHPIFSITPSDLNSGD